ncbi:MAG: hypothetical protein MZV64_23300 [Ignavibacteriales bacterium]|nr:hypothetical protein [Ignavibacteriales bacterium]
MPNGSTAREFADPSQQNRRENLRMQRPPYRFKAAINGSTAALPIFSMAVNRSPAATLAHTTSTGRQAPPADTEWRRDAWCSPAPLPRPAVPRSSGRPAGRLRCHRMWRGHWR